MKFTKNSPLLKLILIGLTLIDFCALWIIFLSLEELHNSVLFYILIFVLLINILLVSLIVFGRKYFFLKIHMDSTSVNVMYKKDIIQEISWKDIDDIEIKYNSYARFLVLSNNRIGKQLEFGITHKRLQKIKELCNNHDLSKKLDKVKISLFSYNIDKT